MTATLSTKGQIVFPKSLRHKYGLTAGDRFTISEEKNRFVFAPQKKNNIKAVIKIDPKLGTPYFSAEGRAGVLTCEMVNEMLADFP